MWPGVPLHATNQQSGSLSVNQSINLRVQQSKHAGKKERNLHGIESVIVILAWLQKFSNLQRYKDLIWRPAVIDHFVKQSLSFEHV